MLQGGFPLARVSNDSGSRDCGVCAAWEGRLIDLTAGNEFRKYGAVPLRAAREAGLFHPNCTHRLEYLSPTEYPAGAWEAFKGRVGEPGAFGNPLKTNAGGETAASAKRRAQQAAKAAEERARKDAQASPIGKAGTWQTLGLGEMGKKTAKPAQPLISTEEALAALHDGKTIKDVFGLDLHLGEMARQHIVDDKKRKQQEIDQRLENLNNVIETIRDPLEVWQDEKKPYTTYIALIEDKKAQKQIVHAVILKGNRVYSWHLNAREFNHGRKGILLYAKGK